MIVAVRLLALPPKTIFAFGTSTGFEELPVSARLAAGVSTSPTVNVIAPLAEFSLIFWSATVEIVGGLFTAVTVN